MGDELGSTVHLTSAGDLRIQVDMTERDKLLGFIDPANRAMRTYVVSSAVISHASPIWKAMFGPGGHFKEANSTSSLREVHLEDDDPDALLLVLRIAHLQFRHLPAALSYEQLLNLAIICDKYDTVEIVRPWFTKWQQPLLSESCMPGHEGWLFIAWTFGEVRTYTNVAKKLAFESATDSKGRCLRSGKVLENHMPPGATDNILHKRKLMIALLLQDCQRVAELYQAKGPVCQVYGKKKAIPETDGRNDDDRSKCDSLNLGCLTKAFKAAGIELGPTGVDCVHDSVSDFMRTLRFLPCYPLKSYHDRCNFTKKIVTDVLLKEVDEEEHEYYARRHLSAFYQVDESIFRHMAEQAKK